MRFIIPLTLSLLLSACVASPEPDMGVFDSARQAIAAAERAGAEELAPVELRFAREKLEAAIVNMEAEEYQDAQWLAEQSQINSELAIEQSRTAKSRRKVNELQRSNEILREELNTNFGGGFE